MLFIGKRKYLAKTFICPKQAFLSMAVAVAIGTIPAMLAQAPGGLSGNAILDHLNSVIDWYRHALTRVPTVGLPSDAVYQTNAQNMAAQVVQLAFQSAQAEGSLIPAASPASVPGSHLAAEPGEDAERRECPHQRTGGANQRSEPADSARS